MSDCRHFSIQILHNNLRDLTIWVCGNCRRRFYPACEQCVDVGHRTGHGEHPEETTDD